MQLPLPTLTVLHRRSWQLEGHAKLTLQPMVESQLWATETSLATCELDQPPSMPSRCSGSRPEDLLADQVAVLKRILDRRADMASNPPPALVLPYTAAPWTKAYPTKAICCSIKLRIWNLLLAQALCWIRPSNVRRRYQRLVKHLTDVGIGVYAQPIRKRNSHSAQANKNV